MLERARSLSIEVNKSLDDLKARIDEVDPNGLMHELRVFLTYALRLAVNQEILRTDAADMEAVRDKVRQIADFPRHIGYRATGETNLSSRAQEKDDLSFTAKLYGVAWGVFDRDRFAENANLLARRFRANGVDLGFIKNGTALDFGCGTGRNCLALARLGAGKVHGVDLSTQNIENARRYLEHFSGESKRIELESANVFERFANVENTYDLVVAQGVLMTMPSPPEALRLVHKILKPGGQFFVYIFGQSDQGGGCFFPVWDAFRHLLKPVPIELTKSMMIMLDARQGDIFNVLDAAYVPHQHRVPRSQFEKMMADAGFKEQTALLRGERYDGHQRILDYPWEKEFWGDYDLRYLVRK
jgi:SAM-dependent methyltransferase